MTVKIILRTYGPGEDFRDVEVPPLICCGQEAVQYESEATHISQACEVCGREYSVSVSCFKRLSGLDPMFEPDS